MNLKAFKKWYMIHVNEIITDGSGAVHSAKILQLLNDLNVFDNIETLNETRNNKNREFILDIIKLVASFMFNILLCGMVFSYERFAPIITKCFGWVRPMPIYGGNMEEDVKTEATPSKARLFLNAVLKFFKKLWQTVFLPALKSCISEGVNRTTQHILYHTPLDANPSMPNNGSKPMPNGAPWQPTSRPVQSRSACWKESEPNRFGVQQVCASDRRTLESIYARMQARLADPASCQTVSVGEMYNYANLPSTFPDYHDGWRDINGCYIQFDSRMNAFVLMMTEPMKL